MKNPLILLTALLVLGVSACSAPYFTKPFDEGVKVNQLPDEYLGEYKIITRYIESETGDYKADTSKETILLVSNGVFMNIDSGETVNPLDTANEDFISLKGEDVAMMKYKGVYYISSKEKSPTTDSIYYIITQVKKTKKGLLMKWIDNDDARLIEKLEKRCKKEKVLYTSPKCEFNCNIPVFSCDSKKLHKFFESEIPDSLAILLVKM